MGPAYHIRSAAEALSRHETDTYFLQDRDHQDTATVEASWRNFPDPAHSNLLIWRKRELENYFLDPDYLRLSSYCRKKAGEPEESILHHANDRLYLDAVNQVIVAIREEQKRNWIELFNQPADFRSKEGAWQQLRNAAAFGERTAQVTDSVAADQLRSRLEATIAAFSGGTIPLQFGHGSWQDRLRGRKIFPSVLTTCCKVQDSAQRPLQGKEQRNAVVKDLLRKPLEVQPADFQELHRLIRQRLEMPYSPRP
ncbi:MAG: hypothetical protein H7835_04105 [Magnetococcus sp. XQGC-1]